jgi:hypothetical protein
MVGMQSTYPNPGDIWIWIQARTKTAITVISFHCTLAICVVLSSVAHKRFSSTVEERIDLLRSTGVKCGLQMIFKGELRSELTLN